MSWRLLCGGCPIIALLQNQNLYLFHEFSLKAILLLEKNITEKIMKLLESRNDDSNNDDIMIMMMIVIW